MQAVRTIIHISIAISFFLIWFIYFKTPVDATWTWVKYIPYSNAFFNTLCVFFLLQGIRAIKNKQETAHKRYMFSALVSSALFLIGYLLYHNYHGDTVFLGQGFIRPIYYFILISHIVLSIVALPMILITVYFALTEKLENHKKIARYTFPIWLYVSVTGVLVFFFLRLFN